MTNRRRLLLSYLANSFKFLPYSYEYLYNSLIPTTIRGKTVKNKAKVKKVYGNGIIENQLNSNGDFNDDSSSGYIINEPAYESVSISNNKMTCTLLQNVGSGVAVNLKTNGVFYKNHKFLCFAKVKSLVGNNGVRLGFSNSSGEYVEATINQGVETIIKGFITLTSNNTLITSYIRMHGALSSGNSIEISEFAIIDLTKAYPFDIPTTLTDNRVQEILNRGYIPYNLGEIKDTDIGEISTTKSDTSNLDTITLKYQGGGINTSHNTLEITNTAYVFTRNNAYVDLGSMTFSQSAQYGFYSSTLNSVAKRPNSNNDMPNILCDRFSIVPRNNSAYQSFGNNTITLDVSGDIDISYANGVSVSDFTTAMSGVMLEYQLATPQTITIPKKHLGIVDLGSLNYVAQGNGRFVSSGLVSTIKPISDNANIGNIYCCEYLSVSYYNISTNMSICVHTSGNIYIQDNSKSNMSATDFKNAMSGVLLFYETDQETTDMEDTIKIESGGTITTDSNVLPNIDLDIKCK